MDLSDFEADWSTNQISEQLGLLHREIKTQKKGRKKGRKKGKEIKY